MSAVGSIITICSQSCRLPSICCPRRTARFLRRMFSSGVRTPTCRPIRKRSCRSNTPC
nr:MAG TPA: hypothetical protein [Caudoviricetes sp.]